MNFQQQYDEILYTFKNEIDLVTEEMIIELNLQEPLISKLLNLLNAPSKHIRPLVSFLCLKAGNKSIDKQQILYQSAIELVHNASLIHDDIIDESTQRREISTINNDFGNKLAVLSGDYLLAIALDKLLTLGNLRLIQMFSDTLKIMSIGEVYQQFNISKIPTINEYIEKSSQKTAKLFETAVCGSLLIAQSSFNGSEFAKNFGIAFQIRDDLINCETTKSDIKQGIYTAPVIFSQDIKNPKNGIEKTKDLLNNYINRTFEQLKYFDNNKYTKILEKLLELMRYE